MSPLLTLRAFLVGPPATPRVGPLDLTVEDGETVGLSGLSFTGSAYTGIHVEASTLTLDDVMRRMSGGRFRHMPVVDAEANVCGMISMSDLVKRRVEELEQELVSSQ